MKHVTLDIKCMYSEIGLNAKTFVLVSFALRSHVVVLHRTVRRHCEGSQSCMNYLHDLFIFFKFKCLEC